MAFNTRITHMITFLPLIRLLLGFPVLGLAESTEISSARRCYVTLLYGESFIVGARVLGESLRKTGTKYDMMALTTKGVSPSSEALLQNDGWKVKRVSLLSNPNRGQPSLFWGVYTKLHIFNLTEYDQVVYLDADALALRNIDEMFECGDFCATLRHSERFNTGVLVLKPSQATFEDMLENINRLPSYTGGDQGFLNLYFKQFANSPLFLPNSTTDVQIIDKTSPRMSRLPTVYNADVGLYILVNKWQVDGDLKIVHYTFGPLKPWQWWSEWLLKPVNLWQDIRRSLPDTNFSGNEILLFFLPLAITAVLYGKFFLLQLPQPILPEWTLHGAASPVKPLRDSPPSFTMSSHFHNDNSPLSCARFPSWLGTISVFAFILSAMAGIRLSSIIVPVQCQPWTGLLLSYEWSLMFFSLFFGKFLEWVYLWGKNDPLHRLFLHKDSKPQHRGSNLWDLETLWFGFQLVTCSIFSLSAPFLFGIETFTQRVLTLIVCGMSSIIFMVTRSQQVAYHWYMLGREWHGK